MIKRWGGEFEGSVEEKLARGGDEQIGAANDLSDFLSCVVHHYGELIGGNAVLLPYREIPEIVSGHKLLRAVMCVLECDGLPVWHAETPVAVLLGRFELCPARSGVQGFAAFAVRRGYGVFKVAPGASAGKQVARLLELLESLPIQVQPIGLMYDCLLYTSPSPRDRTRSRMPSSA